MGESKSSNYSWEEYLNDASSMPSNVSDPKNLDKDTFNWARESLPSVLFGNNKKRNQKKSIAEVHKMRNYRRHKKDSNAKFLKFIKDDFKSAKRYKENTKTTLGRIMNMKNPLGKKNLGMMAATTRLDQLEMPTFDNTFSNIPDNPTLPQFDPSEEYEELGQNLDGALESAMPKDYASVNFNSDPEYSGPHAGSAFTNNLSNDYALSKVSNQRMSGGKKRRTRKKKHKKNEKTRRKRKTKTKRRRPKRRRRTRKR